MGHEDRLAELRIALPGSPQPVASYVPVVVAGGLAFVSGQIVRVEAEVSHAGKVGAEVSLEQAQGVARTAALQALAALRDELGSLDRVVRIVNVGVYVASAPGFTQQSLVANGASEVLWEIFGDAGTHSRAAVGVAELPLGAPVEVTLVAAVS